MSRVLAYSLIFKQNAMHCIHCSSCGLWKFQIRSHHWFCEECAALAANHTKGTFWSVHFGLQGHSWACTYVLIWFGDQINGDPSTLRLAVISTLATNSSSTSSTVRRTCFCGWWSNIIEFTSQRRLRCDIINNILSSTKVTFVYHRVWKQLIMTVITSTWILIVRRRCWLAVL